MGSMLRDQSKSTEEVTLLNDSDLKSMPVAGLLQAHAIRTARILMTAGDVMGKKVLDNGVMTSGVSKKAAKRMSLLDARMIATRERSARDGIGGGSN